MQEMQQVDKAASHNCASRDTAFGVHTGRSHVVDWFLLLPTAAELLRRP